VNNSLQLLSVSLALIKTNSGISHFGDFKALFGSIVPVTSDISYIVTCNQ